MNLEVDLSKRTCFMGIPKTKYIRTICRTKNDTDSINGYKKQQCNMDIGQKNDCFGFNVEFRGVCTFFFNGLRVYCNSTKHTIICTHTHGIHTNGQLLHLAERQTMHNSYRRNVTQWLLLIRVL